MKTSVLARVLARLTALGARRLDGLAPLADLHSWRTWA
jgi:hypothetical protein